MLWLIIGAPEKELDSGQTLDQKLVYPVDQSSYQRSWTGASGRRRTEPPVKITKTSVGCSTEPTIADLAVKA